MILYLAILPTLWANAGSHMGQCVDVGWWVTYACNKFDFFMKHFLYDISLTSSHLTLTIPEPYFMLLLRVQFLLAQSKY